MVKINRLNLKVVWAQSGIVADPDLDLTHPNGLGGPGRYLTGFVAGKEPHQWANFLYQTRDVQLKDVAQRNFLQALPDTPWLDKAVATNAGAEKCVYRKVDATWARNLMHLPDAQYRQILEGAAARGNAHIANTNNSHELTAAQAGTYLSATVDAWKGAFRNEMRTHTDHRANPHNETAVQIGTIPKEGGTFLGDVNYAGGVVLLPQVEKLIKGGVFIPKLEGYLAFGGGESATTRDSNLYIGELPRWGTSAAPAKRLIPENLYLPISGELDHLVTYGAPILEVDLQAGINSRTVGGVRVKYNDLSLNSQTSAGQLVVSGMSMIIPGYNKMKAAGCRAVIALRRNGVETAYEETTASSNEIGTSQSLALGDFLMWVKVYPPLSGCYNRAGALQETLHNGGANR